MKYIAMLVVLLTSCYGTKKDSVSYIDQVIIRDRTDPHKLLPDYRAHIASLHLPEHKDNAFTIRYVEILDRKTTPVTLLHLPGEAVTDEQNTADVPMYREHLIVQFMDTIRKTLLPAPPTTNDSDNLAYSEIFSTVAKELSGLAKRQAVVKQLFLYSNLQENSTLFSCYTKANQVLLAHHSDSVVSLFRKQALLPTQLHGVTVYFIYDAQSREADCRYQFMIVIYRQLLQQLGAHVIVQAQNKSFEDTE